MSETPGKPVASVKGSTKRGGLALPPRGQALARLQDLEEEGQLATPTDEDTTEGLPLTASSNAVNTASSNAVPNDVGADRAPALLSEGMVISSQIIQPPVTTAPKAAVASDHQAPIRAVREPTTRITVDMPDSLHQKISVLSAQTRRSIKDLVIEALAATYFGTGTDPQ